MDSKVADSARATFAWPGAAITLGAPVHGGAAHPEPLVKLPVSMMTRHGLIAGATGTGKTKTLQLMAEQLSAAGVPVFLADVKGDLSGIAAPGESSDRVKARIAETGAAWAPAGFKFCDDRDLLLLDFADLRAVLQYLSGEGEVTRGLLGALLGKPSRRR